MRVCVCGFLPCGVFLRWKTACWTQGKAQREARAAFTRGAMAIGHTGDHVARRSWGAAGPYLAVVLVREELLDEPAGEGGQGELEAPGAAVTLCARRDGGRNFWPARLCCGCRVARGGAGGTASRERRGGTSGVGRRGRGMEARELRAAASPGRTRRSKVRRGQEARAVAVGARGGAP